MVSVWMVVVRLMVRERMDPGMVSSLPFRMISLFLAWDEEKEEKMNRIERVRINCLMIN